MQPLRVIFCASLWHGLLSPSCGYRKRAEFTALEQLVEDARLAVKEQHNMSLKEEKSAHSDLMMEDDFHLLSKLREARNKPKKQIRLLKEAFRLLGPHHGVISEKELLHMAENRNPSKTSAEAKKLAAAIGKDGKVDFAEFAWITTYMQLQESIDDAVKEGLSEKEDLSAPLKKFPALFLELKKNFDELDENDNDRVKFHELMKVLTKQVKESTKDEDAKVKKAAMDGLKEAEEVNKEQFKAIDASEDGTITLAEYVWYAGRQLKKELNSEIEKMKKQKEALEVEDDPEPLAPPGPESEDVPPPPTMAPSPEAEVTESGEEGAEEREEDDDEEVKEE
eukprot:TRINITY_DN4757_c0_g2_i1.p1 TRINITY_DN4757_c0_g2~~TRINITY_DN4757_c0_g2_i1.p1  ORF type:complete len:337 (+),score=102.85 TRINITY_DN4757_c0_g2_i1:79-1089(+)